MKRIPMLAMALLVPVVLFAQTPLDRNAAALKRLGLTDDQAAKVEAVVTATRTKVKDDLVHIRLIKAQIDEAILPSTAQPDMGAVGKLVDQQSQLRADMEKSLLSAEVQLIQIMGRENFQKYYRSLRLELGLGERSRMAFKGRFGRDMPFRAAQPPAPPAPPAPQGGSGS